MAIAALVALIAASSQPCAPRCGHDGDWRDALPPLALAAVARVDDKSDRDKRHAADLQADEALGKEYAAEVEKEYKLSKDAEGTGRVQRIGSELAAIANANQVLVSWGDTRLNPFNYSFKLLEGKDVNAFSLPGGYIYVYEGLLKYCESDDELAGVLAHEISHAAFRHVATLRKEQSRLDAVTLPLVLIAIFTGGSAGTGLAQTSSLVSQAIGSGWSVKAEESADYGGFQYMLKTKYNPVAMLTFMERLAYDDRNRPAIDWGIYRTHPPTRERARALRDRLFVANVPIRRSEVSTTLRASAQSEADGSVRVLFAGTILHTFGGPDAAERAEAACKDVSNFMDLVPRIYDVRLSEETVTGRGRALFTVTEEDAKAVGKPVAIVAQDALRALKSATYDLGYRVWDAF